MKKDFYQNQIANTGTAYSRGCSQNYKTKIRIHKGSKVEKKYKKFEKKCNFKLLTQKLQKIALELGNLVKPAFWAGYLGISIGRAKYLQKYVLQKPDLQRQQLAFTFDAQHQLWIQKFVAQENIAHLSSAKQIIQEFIANFHICIQQLQFHYFLSCLNSLGYILIAIQLSQFQISKQMFFRQKI
ncbi:unnamed protein product [Paramecium pentaurelia]|uniref:Transmembrane protein n=1 Tax=Paramecium pentaurelia TaxID=43138 RepID=A0A8S1YPR3_9CILI|nr:unnamed protein product [Paramecium pentaurelia]